MKKNYKHTHSIHAIVASIMIALNVLIIANLEMVLLELIIGNAFVYAAALFAVDKVYRLIWKLTHKKYHIHGKWYILQRMENDTQYMRTGTANITQDFYLFDIKADTFNVVYKCSSGCISFDEEQKTSWIEKMGTIQEDITGDCTMEGNYTARRDFNDSQMLVGFHQYEITQPNPKEYPTEIAGYFFDSVPITNRGVDISDILNYNRVGRIKMYRKEEDRDNYLKEKCKPLAVDGVYKSSVKKIT